MEPEIIALARRMFAAHQVTLDDGCSHRDCDGRRRAMAEAEWDSPDPKVRTFAAYRRAFLAAAIVARPDLADVRVEPGHWAAGILPTREPSVRVGEEPGGWMNGRRVKP